jgi:hypothetical protein
MSGIRNNVETLSTSDRRYRETRFQPPKCDRGSTPIQPRRMLSDEDRHHAGPEHLTSVTSFLNRAATVRECLVRFLLSLEDRTASAGLRSALRSLEVGINRPGEPSGESDQRELHPDGCATCSRLFL